MLIGLQPRFRQRIRLIQTELELHDFHLFATHRTPERQHELFMRGGVTRADAWQSAHQYGLGADFARKINGKWSWEGDFSIVKTIAEKYGCLVPAAWDAGHVESPDWRELRKHLVTL